MDIAKQEVFGPVMLLMRFRDDNHAVEIANDTSYGLSSSVFSKDHARARRIVDQLEAGMSAVNDFGGITYMAQDLTFGGVKESGFGRMNGREGLRAMCNIKSVVEDRFPIHQPTKMYPVKPEMYAKISAALDLVYGRGLKQRWRGLLKLLGIGR
jgi:acyl-CoA reductase-like NAD-dependent aldehyde dehydrogenase